MKRILAALIGLGCCAGTTYAANPFGSTPNIHRLDLSAGQAAAPRAALLTSAELQPSPRLTAAEEEDSGFDIGAVAYKVSYIGSLILTADQIVRSVDSVLDSMEWTREDGTRLRLLMEPGSKGFEVMMRVSRPIDF